VKQLIFALSICLTFGVTAAFADGGADLYAKRCSKCHGADGSKASGASGGTMLKGLSVDAAKGKLMGYRDGTYGGAKKKIMMRLTSKFSDQEIAELAEVIGGF